MNTVLILGASRGIGYEFARQYVQEGWRVLATARDDAGCTQLQAIGAEAFKLDVAKPNSVSGLSWRLDGEKLDLALYVAGVIDRNSPQTPPTQEEFDRIMHTNVLGAMQALPQVAPWVAEANGTFAFISSVMASMTLTDSGGASLYKVSKAALNMVVRTAPSDFPKVTWLALSPGWVQTDMGGNTAPLTVLDSVAQMRATLNSVGGTEKRAAVQGQFLNYDGSTLPW
jgi:NAD(P)-dependent dehydrogenase (short-subunit alcohol dehydrogenase family)